MKFHAYKSGAVNRTMCGLKVDPGVYAYSGYSFARHLHIGGRCKKCTRALIKQYKERVINLEATL